jgi:DNA topoisomerase-1
MAAEVAEESAAPKKKVTKKKAAKKKVAKKKVAKKVAKKTAAKKKVTKAKKKTASSSGVTKKRRPTGPYDLVIVESPSKAKTIKKYLGRGYQVVASNGHIKDLPKSKLGVDVDKNFNSELVPITGKKNVIEKITDLAKKADNIFLAPDPDREGEAIAFHIAEEIRKKKNVHRVMFNSITKEAVKEAMQHPLELDTHKYDSQKTRRILDRLVGYKISPILWEKVQRGLSAGRVQSVALRIIVEREKEVREFKPEPWYSVHAILEEKGQKFEALYYSDNKSKKTDLFEQKQVDEILKATKGHPFVIDEIQRKERRQNPTPPFTTSKLQQEAANKLGFTARRTMRVAQKLYEGVDITDRGATGLITYMRTDSVRIDPSALETVRGYIKDNYSNEYLPAEPRIFKKKKGGGKVQDAHEAIRPTDVTLTPSIVKPDLEDEEYKLYSLIWNKFVASQMTQAVIDQTTVFFNVNGHYFKTTGSVIKFAGFRTIYLEALAEKRSKRGGEDDEEFKPGKSNELPAMDEDASLNPDKGPYGEEHWTSPPPRYNEASIVKELEEQGIGRPSTYASIISNILDRGYVEKTENRFLPTELGAVVCQMLVESFPNEMDVAFTARIEESLDHIEEGEIKWTKVLKDFWKPFEKTLVKAKEEMKNLKRQEIPTGIKCLKCDSGEYFIKWGRNGQFFACSNYPECNSTQDFRRDLDGVLHIIPKEYVKDTPCPSCESRMVVKKGRYGRFLACENYPNCKTTLPFTLDTHCPECKKGKFVEKTSRYGKLFYGCSSYPDCNHAMWARPYAFDCPSCSHPVMGKKETKRDGVHLACPKCRTKVPIGETPYTEEKKPEPAKMEVPGSP